MNIDDLYRILRSGHSQLQGIVDTLPDPLVVLDARLCVVDANRAFYKAFKVERFETVGREIYELGNGQWNNPRLRLLLEDVIPHSSAIIDFRVDHEFPDLGRRTMLLTARTLFHPDNVSRTLLLSIVDATDRLQRESRNEILFGEMRHRTKNFLATAQAMARLSSVEGRTAKEFRDEFLERFGNMIRSSEMAFGGDPVSLGELIETILAPYSGKGSMVLTGDTGFDPGPTLIQGLSMVLYELATNAAKYGSLSVPDGRVEIHVSVDPDKWDLRLSWTERGGPPTSPPTRTGYGSKLISSTITHNLGGRQEQNYGPDGFSTDLTIPISTASGFVEAESESVGEAVCQLRSCSSKMTA